MSATVTRHAANPNCLRPEPRPRSIEPNEFFRRDRGTNQKLIGFTGDKLLRGHALPYGGVPAFVFGADGPAGEVRVLAEKSDRKPSSRKSTAKSNDAVMGEALRSVYQKTVDESVPEEFLALLGKLD